MSYLYGDSTPSALESNFIQFLGQCLDVSVHLLLSGDRMARGRERILALKGAAEREMESLETLGAAVARVLRETPKGDAASPTATGATIIAEHADETVRWKVAQLRASLAADVAAAESEAAAERLGCVTALESLLRLHDPPGAATTFHLVANGAGKYACRRTTQTPYGIAWTLAIEIAPPHPFSQVARVDKVFPPLEMGAAESGGWLRRTSRFDKLFLREMTFTPSGAVLRLRSSLDEETTGLDVEYAGGTHVRLTHFGERQGAIEPSQADAEKLALAHAKLRGLVHAIDRIDARLEEATLDDRPIADLCDPGIVVDRLVAAMAPIVAEIARRSRSATELALKKVLDEHRREEIFVSKAALHEKLAALPEPLRVYFAPLNLGAAPPPLQPVARAALTPS